MAIQRTSPESVTPPQAAPSQAHPSRAAGPDSPALKANRAVLADLFGLPAGRSFAVRYWNGLREGPAQPTFTLVLRHPGALRRLLVPPTELNGGEAYLRDDVDVEGDLESAAGLVDTIVGLQSPGRLARLLPRLLALPSGQPARGGPAGRRARGAATRHTKDTDSEAIRFHYDVGNAFYALWLDRRLVYSCAYFPTGHESLDEAQEAKLEHICRKLRLKPGEHLLDIGCGWGGLMMHAAERYGVHATGITLSLEQAALARERIAAAGLSNRCRVEVLDYRDLPPGSSFDKVVSVGMVEHVGRRQLPGYFAQAYRLTRPGGLFLNHGIVNPRLNRIPDFVRREFTRLTWRATSFIEKYVFPGGELVLPSEVLAEAEAAGFETRDVESLREHYATTLRHWVRRLEAHHDEAAALVGEATYRVWRIYMAGQARAFTTGVNGVIQVLLTRPHQDGSIELPPSRADLYRA